MTVQDYLNLPYTKTIRKDDEGDFVATVIELSGCVADGPSESAALEALSEAQELWIRNAIETGISIPEPLPDVNALPSGKWLQRVPRRLHHQLIQLAEVEGASLNQLVTSILAEGVGRKTEQRAKWRQVRDAASHAYRERLGWIVHAWPRWETGSPKGATFGDTEVLVYLDALARQLPNHGEMTDQEFHDVHEGPGVLRVSSKRSSFYHQPHVVKR